MPSLSLNHPMPIIAVYGVMLYPREVASDQRNARAFPEFQLKTALKKFRSEGGEIPEHLENFLQSAAKMPKDADKRSIRGAMAGEIFKIAFELVLNDPQKASWQSAYRIVSRYRKEGGLKTAGVRSNREFCCENKEIRPSIRELRIR